MEAKLTLSSWEIFLWKSFGYEWATSWEVVFNTGMLWYPETLTDPSYAGQILVSTYPLIWNYGIPDFSKTDAFWLKQYFESDIIHLHALIVSEYSENYNHHEGDISLSDFLKQQKIPAITGIDTRYLTQYIRDNGCQLWKIEIWSQKIDGTYYDPNQDLLAHKVCIRKKRIYWSGNKKICVVDMGVKNNIIRNLLKYDTTIVRVPWDYLFSEELDQYDGIFISNGPWDPSLYTKTISQIQKSLSSDIPMFWICLWNQLLALAAWAKTYKLRYWHRWQNQPCRDTLYKKCIVTSQNHWFAIDDTSLPHNIKTWFENINDGTNEGIYFTDKNIKSVQFHPESSPGPNDAAYLFHDFVSSL